MENYLDHGANHPKIGKDHADRLAVKATSYYQAKSTPRNFCKAVDDIDEGRDLLQAFDECCEGGMDPEEGKNLIFKCAGAMGGPMSGPLAATLATRPVKKMADGTIGGRGVVKALEDEPITEEMRAQAREILKAHPDLRPDGSMSVHTKSHYRVRNGRVEYIMDYDSNRHGHHEEATLHQRSVAGSNRNGDAYIRATDSEDRDKILAKAREMGVHVVTHRASGANHHGRQSAYPHIYFSNEGDAARVHAALAPEASRTITPAQVLAAAEPDPEVAAFDARISAGVAQAREAQALLFSTHRAGLLDRRVWMENTSEGHSKFFAVDLRQVGDGKWVVNTAHGRIGAARPVVKTKTTNPVSQAVANQLVDQIKREKLGGGYAVQDDSATPRLARYSPLDNFQHPSVMPAAQQAVEARAAATSGGIGAPPPSPAPAPAAAPAMNYGTYKRLRDAAYNGASASDIAGTIARHQTALEAALALPEGTVFPGAHGPAYHRDRIAVWQRQLDGGWTDRWNAANASIANVENTTEGFAAKVSAVNAALALVTTKPGTTTAPANMTPAHLERLKKLLPGLGGGAILESVAATTSNLDGVKTLEKLKAGLTGVINEGMISGSVSSTVLGKLHTEIDAATEKAQAAMSKAAQVVSGDAEPEEALEAIQAAHRTAASITAAATATGQPWAKVVERMAASAVAKVATLKPAMERAAARPRKADRRWANTSDAARAKADASHALTLSNPTSHAHHRTAFDHAKRAATATYHEALTKKGEERQRLQALANTYADRAKAIATKYATLGRR